MDGAVERVRQLIGSVDAWAQRRSFTRVVRGTIVGFFEHDTLQYAGSMAYFAMLSIVQVAILAVVLLSTLFGEGEAREFLLERVEDTGSPINAETVETLIDATLESWASLTIIGVGFLIWCALGMFASLSRGVGRVFAAAPPDLFGWDLLRGIVLMLLAGALALIAVLVGLVTDALQRFAADALAAIPGAELAVTLIGLLVPLVLGLVAFWVLYRVVPTRPVRAIDALWGAIVATLLWTVLRIGYTVFTTRLAPTGPTAFATVSAAIGLLVFLYFASIVVLIGAEFAHASGVDRSERTVPADDARVMPDPSSAPGP